MAKVLKVRGGEVLVDDSDLLWASKIGWYLTFTSSSDTPTVTAVDRSSGEEKHITLAREVVLRSKEEIPESYRVVHLDWNRLNNTRANLKVLSPGEAIQHTISNPEVRTPGVHYNSWKKRWIATIHYRGKKVFLGAHVDKSAALRQREDAEKRIADGLAPTPHEVKPKPKRSPIMASAWAKRQKPKCQTSTK